MQSQIHQLLFPEIFEPHVIDIDWIFMDDDNDNEINVRRPYRIRLQVTMNNWDDFDFRCRFRVTKRTFLSILELVAPILQHPQPR